MASDLDALIRKINKDIGKDVVKVGTPQYEYERIPFTSPRLNYMTYGGLPKGKLIEFYGDNGSGKTTTALDVVANFLHSSDERKVLYADAENTLDAIWATKLGIDLDSGRFIVIQPENQSAEELLQWILDFIETGEIGLAILDSIGMLVSAQALEKTLEEKTFCGVSGAMTSFSSKCVQVCSKHNCTFIGLNQIRDNVSGYGGSTLTPGGRAWKHACIARFEFRKGSYFDQNHKALSRGCESAYGNEVEVAMIKNKSCPPTRKTGYYTLTYLHGIDYLYDLVEVAIKYGVVERKGAWFTILDPSTGEILANNIQGQAKVYEYLKNDDNIEVLTAIESFIDSKIQED